jgi:hypothetical protein
MEYARKRNLDGIILLIDFEKAFDTVKWSFLMKALDKFGFGDNFKQWIRILYTNPENSIINNAFSPQCGIRPQALGARKQQKFRKK